MTDKFALVEVGAFAALDGLAPDGTLAVAVSGGGDSMALLHLAARWGASRNRVVVAVSVDHGLRAAARAECSAVAWQAKRLGLEHVTQRAERREGSLQAAMREARLAALTRWAHTRGIERIALAQTEDDQAETMLLRLARGGVGVDGLAAMRPARRHTLGHEPGAPSVTFVRPLLDQSRVALRAWLRDQGIGWIEEPSNLDPRYDRVRAREALAVLAPLGLTAPRLATTARRLAGEARVLHHAAVAVMDAAVARGPAGELLLDAGSLLAVPGETALRVIAWAAGAVSGAAYPPRREALERALSFLRRLASGERPGDEALADGVLMVVSERPAAGDGTAMALCREPSAAAPPVAADAGAVWDARIVFAGTAPGEATIGALGAAAQDVAADTVGHAPGPPWRRAPRAARLSAPALFAADGALLAVAVNGYVWYPSHDGACIDLPPAIDLVARRLQRARDDT